MPPICLSFGCWPPGWRQTLRASLQLTAGTVQPPLLQHVNCKGAGRTNGAVHSCRCVAKLQQAGLKVLADIVINHRCAQGQDSKGIWNQFGGWLHAQLPGTSILPQPLELMCTVTRTCTGSQQKMVLLDTSSEVPGTSWPSPLYSCSEWLS